MHRMRIEINNGYILLSRIRSINDNLLLMCPLLFQKLN